MSCSLHYQLPAAQIRQSNDTHLQNQSDELCKHHSIRSKLPSGSHPSSHSPGILPRQPHGSRDPSAADTRPRPGRDGSCRVPAAPRLLRVPKSRASAKISVVTSLVTLAVKSSKYNVIILAHRPSGSFPTPFLILPHFLLVLGTGTELEKKKADAAA